MLMIPLQAVPNQVVNVLLVQALKLQITQRATGLFIDVYVNDVLVLGGVICENLNRIVRDAYLGFIGDLIFGDMQGSTDPVYTGLGSRYVLAYVTADEAATLEAAGR